MMKLKHIKYTCYLSLLIIFVACSMDGNVTVELSGYEGEDPHQISVMGYLSNMGAVIEVQRAAAPYYDDSLSLPITGIEAVLITNDESSSVTRFLPYNEKVFYTPESFLPRQGIEYTLKIQAPGFDEVTSLPVQLPAPFYMDSIQIISKFEQNIPYFDPDTILQYLFGQRTFYDVVPKYSINSLGMADGGCVMTLNSNGNCFRKIQYKYQKSDLPMDLLFDGSLFFFDYPRFNFSDLIATGDTLQYAGKHFAIMERVDSVRFQAFCFDSLNVRFYEEQFDYLYSNEPYFSIVNQTISTMSNGIGLFIGAWVASETMHFEQPASDSLNIYQP